MEKAAKFLPLILGSIVAIVVFFVSRKIKKENETKGKRSKNGKINIKKIRR
jgi:uncharacterized metal-binding protein